MHRPTLLSIARVVALLATLVVLPGGLALAQATDSEGAASSGTNDSLGTAQNLGSFVPGAEMTVNGWVDSGNEFDVDFYRFTLGAGETVYLDIDFAEDIGASSDDDVGLDAAIWVFDSTGTLVAYNDDSSFFVIGLGNEGTDPGSDPWADHDSFIGGLPLAAGTYYVAVAWYSNNANATDQSLSTSSLSHSGYLVSGATPDATFANAGDCEDRNDPESQCVGPYQLNIRGTFRSGGMIPALSLPGLALLALAIAVAGLISRRAIA